eukprot:602024-Prorocentrum_minimum.AAC.1
MCIVSQVVLGGVLVGLGYHKLEAETANRFVEVNGARWYRTGDLGRLLTGGDLELHGRADDQVK